MVITGDESWVYSYAIETKAQSSYCKRSEEPRPKKARQVRENVNVSLTVFLYCNDVVYHEFISQARTVDTEYYLEVMRRMREAIRQKRTELWKNQSRILHYDNGPAHTSILVREFKKKKTKTKTKP